MDLFDEILEQASSNTKKAYKEIKKIDEARENKKKISLNHSRLQKQKVEQNNKEAERAKFVIPKKPARKLEQNVDQNKVMMYLKKKKEEEQKRLNEMKRQKEELIKLRLQSYGGKANKKIAKHFGYTPIELQQKYGNDREHEECLKKRQMREEEEAERLKMELSGGIKRALERKKVVDAVAGSRQKGNAPPHRMAINKKNSLRHLMREDSPGPSSSTPTSLKPKKDGAGISVKQRAPPNARIDFSALMRKAEAMQNRLPESPSPEPQRKKTAYEELISREVMKAPKENNEVKRRRKDVEQILRKDDGRTSQKAVALTGNAKHSHGEQPKKSFSAESTRKTGISAASDNPVGPPQSGRRYLPGDLRYQGSVEKGRPPCQTGVARSDNVVRTKPVVENLERANISKVTKDSRRGENLSARGLEKNGENKRMMSREEMIARYRAREKMMQQRKPPPRDTYSGNSRRHYDDYEDLEDEEYDSEMDDFIDDSEFDEHIKRGDLEETLRLINPRYDKNRWKMRERLIDDRRMEASYRDIAREEKRSSRIGLLEDLREAETGKSVAL